MQNMHDLMCDNNWKKVSSNIQMVALKNHYIYIAISAHRMRCTRQLSILATYL